VSILERIDDAVNTLHEQAMNVERFRYHHAAAIREMADALDDVVGNLIHTDIDGMSVDFSFSGDKNTLNAIFKAFRRNGYEPDNRPKEEPQEYFHTWFRKPGGDNAESLKFYVSFSSKMCTRTKIGTKTQEVDVFEVVCE